MAKKAYYSARTGGVSTSVDLPTFRDLFGSLYGRQVSEGFLYEAFGNHCVDAGYQPGTVGENISAFFLLKLRKQGLWPIDEQHGGYSEADLFSVIELLYDLVSTPDKKTGHYHSWSDCGWHYTDFDKASGQQSFRDAINEILTDYNGGFRLSDSGQILRSKTAAAEGTAGSLVDVGAGFDALFTFGLPVGLHGKPSGAVEYGAQGQTFSFHETALMGVVRGDVYPNYCMHDFKEWANPKERLGSYVTPPVVLQTAAGIVQDECLTMLSNICQTVSEKLLLKAYLETFVAPHARPSLKPSSPGLDFLPLKDKIPALLPQAWINWRSNDREALKRMGYKYANATMRFDFVVFWQSRNFVVQVDSIEHYAEKVNERWDANEERYAARLKEDRLLRMQGWNIFRLGNWETRDPERLKQVLEELRMFIGFEHVPVAKVEERDDVAFTDYDDEIPY